MWDTYLKITDTLTSLFPVWTVLFASLAFIKPELFTWFGTEYFTAALATLMLSMGITLKAEDFSRVVQEPSVVILGFLLCFVVCPLLGLGLGRFFGLPMDLTSGLVLVGCLNGGQSSNLCTYIANGDVALSVLMTTITTIAGIFTTPLLCKLLLGAVVPVDAQGIAVSCLQVVLAPILLGMAANAYAPKMVEKITPATPVVGVASTCLLVASAVSQCAPALKAAGSALQMAILLLHLVSGLGGYWISRLFKFTETQCRTVAIETAMKSSAFGFLLAKLHFKQFGARLPPAVSVIWMTLTGATLSVIWRFIPTGDEVVEVPIKYGGKHISFL
ncbi:sodium bile acid symporter family-domain-containing protein [Ochromonadaceae sp. CCMP2298]|nr:sodium bile acid symporter family-domain-containing protein [Ochromonadaceae sp. CCMP2298]